MRSIAQWFERLAVNAEVATVLGSIPASSDTVWSEGRQMKKCWVEYWNNNTKKQVVLICWKVLVFNVLPILPFFMLHLLQPQVGFWQKIWDLNLGWFGLLHRLKMTFPHEPSSEDQTRPPTRDFFQKSDLFINKKIAENPPGYEKR